MTNPEHISRWILHSRDPTPVLPRVDKGVLSGVPTYIDAKPGNKRMTNTVLDITNETSEFRLRRFHSPNMVNTHRLSAAANP